MVFWIGVLVLKNMRFHKRYFVAFLLVLGIEIVIASFVHDSFVRPFFGDFLIIFLLYFFFRTFLKFSYKIIAIGVLVFAYLVEILQYINLLKLLNIQPNTFTKLTLGSSFDWGDMLAYTVAFLCIVFAEKWLKRRA